MVCKPGVFEDRIVIPPLRDDPLHSMTVLPYLMDYHYGEDTNSNQYISERELNGMAFL